MSNPNDDGDKGPDSNGENNGDDEEVRDLYVKRVPKDLHKYVEGRAVQEETTKREEVINALREYAENE